VRLLSREDGTTVWHLRAGQRDLLLLLFEAAITRPGRSPGLSRQSPELDSRFRADLVERLEEGRAGNHRVLTGSLRDPVQCLAADQGHRWTLDSDQTEMLLQSLNEIRIGAWERLGCPVGEEDRVEVVPGTVEFLDRWILELSSRFLNVALRGLDPE
jgi:hypothetical protein